MKNRLNTTKALVLSILESNTQARNSDSYLYLKVIEHFDKEYNTDFCNMPVIDFLNGGCDIPVPPFESVRRSRQKVQAEFPHLSACDEVAFFRGENEELYREFARGVNK